MHKAREIAKAAVLQSALDKMEPGARRCVVALSLLERRHCRELANRRPKATPQ